MKFLQLIIAGVLFFSNVVQAEDSDLVREKELLKLNYVEASYAGLSRLTWRYRMHPLNHDKAIDELISILNCDLHQQYFNNDFLWQRVREGTRRELQLYSNQFIDRYEMYAGVGLGRYDFRKSAFEVPSEYSLNKAGLLYITMHDAYNTPCLLESTNTDIYPRRMRFAADNPFTLTHIPVPPEEADALVKRLSKYKYKNINKERMAMMRIRFKVGGIKNYGFNEVPPVLTFSGQLDEIAIFEDPRMSKPIWAKSFKDLN